MSSTPPPDSAVPRLDPRLTDLDAARHVAQRNAAAEGLPAGRAAGLAAVRARAVLRRGADDDRVTSQDVLIPSADGGLDARIYEPAGVSRGVVLFFHGGGWMLGDLNTNDALCRDLSAISGTTVVSVAYRLAPEHPYPAAVDDALTAASWVAAGGDGLLPAGSELAVAGHSAGGNLAPVLAQLSVTGQAPAVVHQLLLCPVLDCDLTRGSYAENGDGLLLTRADMVWYWDLYVPSEAGRLEPTASPLRRADLRGCPPATLVIAAGDPLRDEAVEYARRLTAADVPTTSIMVPGVPHLFLTFPSMHCRDSAVATAAEALANGFRGIGAS